MHNFDSWTRRELLAAGLAASILPWCRQPSVTVAQERKRADAAERKTFLFVDWFHVKKGDLQVTLDPARISPEGKALIEKYDRDFKKKFDVSGHGYKPVDVPFGVRVTLEPAQRSEPWLRADKPWEKSVTSPTVLFDEGKYRCWYSALLNDEKQEATVDQGRVMELSGSALAYAESEDGIHWTKPILNRLSYRSSRENNLVSPFNNGGSIFRDDHGLAEERYKGFQFDELPKDSPGARYGLYGVTSPDGYTWTKNSKPLIRYFCDTVNIAAWDPLMSKYVGYFRHHLSGRTISRAETDDFGEWPAPQPLLHAGPLDGPAQDYYTSCYTTYPGEPSLRLMFPAIYHHDSDSVDVRLSVSRDGRVFQWVSYDPILKPGKAGSWDGGSVYAQPNLVQLPDGRLALPYDAYNTTHNEIFFSNFYREYDASTGIAWAIWDDARLAGIQADQLGQFTTTAALFLGQRIQLNARASRAGSVEVELRERGKAVPGFSFDDFQPLSGDHIWTDCQWKGQDNVGGLRGKYLELAIRLRSAKVFAYRFA
ncbi:sialidase family protein [Schlesneria paludicola]|uniref:sialidase family protein n=1 Tax=Schlesneria paludicola TaxID=360056 RepID=UPI00030C507E|nr:sialidase family protein [Schlesneria paludicola]